MKPRLSLKIKNPDAKVLDANFKKPPQCHAEVPPSVVNVDGRRYIFLMSHETHALSVDPNAHIIRDPECTLHSTPIYSIGGFDHQVRTGMVSLYAEYDDRKLFWRKNYCGVFTADVLPADKENPQWVISINHCENKNECFVLPNLILCFQNSINPHIRAEYATSSGVKEKGYRDYAPAYFGFVSMSYAPVVPETKWGMILQDHDMGPIIWPQTGILSPDGKTDAPGYKHPHPHPSHIIAEDPEDGEKYIYVFCIDSSLDPDKHNMIIAARSPLRSRGLPGTFMNLYKGDYTEPSLPPQKSEESTENYWSSVNYRDLLAVGGGRADPVHPTAQGGMIRFSVARLKRSGLFLSVESYVEDGYIKTALRLSEDLRTWTDRFPIPNTQVPLRRGFERRKPPYGLFYPKFLSLDGSSHTEIDEAEPFYILGTKPHEIVYRELEIEII